MKLKTILAEYPDSTFKKWEGFDEAVVGIGERCSMPLVLLYDRNKIIKKLAKSMTNEEAVEYFEFNILGAFIGDDTPIIVSL